MAVDVVAELGLIEVMHGGACQNEIRELIRRIGIEGSVGVVGTNPGGGGVVNVDVPYCSQVGDVVSVTMGNWADPAPTDYTYSWKGISGSTPDVVVVAGDVGKSVSCVVSAHRGSEVGSVESNAIVVAAIGKKK
jgi:hypothetical protein